MEKEITLKLSVTKAKKIIKFLDEGEYPASETNIGKEIIDDIKKELKKKDDVKCQDGQNQLDVGDVKRYKNVI